MTPTTSRLTERHPDQIITLTGNGPISVSSFLGRVAGLARVLPQADHAINLCRDRFDFLTAFCAVVLRGKCNLLLANDRPATQASAKQRFGSCYLLHDGGDLDPEIPAIDLRTVTDSGAEDQCPEIPLDQLCALSFTSGSTGESAVVPKSWRTIWQSTAINRIAYLGDADRSWNLLATVPAQHMYGLESSVFMPLRSNVRIHPGRPLFPADVALALQQLQPPRVLVTTPVHMRSLLASNLDFPSVERIISATAPLDRETAEAMEARFDGQLCEIYGCSEAGSIASRRTSVNLQWSLMDAFTARQMSSGWTEVNADHLPAPVVLQDILEWSDSHQFSLKGRATDLINIAGKRGSLNDINQLLLSLPGVVDGVVFERPDGKDLNRLAALVVAPGCRREDVIAALRAQLDDVFIPRPMVLVDSLPRNDTGKLPRAALLALFQASRRQ